MRLARAHLSTLLAIWLVLQFPVAAADITVAGDCSLIGAILAANSDLPEGGCPAGSGADRIFLTEDVILTEKYGDTYYAGLPVVESDIAIHGGGYSIERDSSQNFRFLTVDPDGVLEMFDTSLVDGYGPWFADGGAIANHGTLSVSDSTFLSNGAGYNADAGAILNGSTGTLTLTNSTFTYNGGFFCGAISNFGSMRIENCRFTYNLAASDYFPADNYAKGGAICTGPSHIEGSYFADNNAGHGGAIHGEGLTIVDSTFLRNNALNSGGAILAEGEVRIIGSTFAENTVGEAFGSRRENRSGNRGEGGAIYFEAPDEGTDQRVLLNTTLSNNSALLSGGALWVAGGSVGLVHATLVGNSSGTIHADGGAVYMKNSLLVGYPGEASCSGAGTIVNQGGSLADDDSCGPLPGTLTGVNELLADNGGPTYTHALTSASSARASGIDCDIALDQRDVPRESAGCDSGAYEFGPCEDLVVRDLSSPMETIEACDNLWIGPNAVVEASGLWDVTAGSRIVFRNGVTVEQDASLTVTLDSSLPPP